MADQSDGEFDEDLLNQPWDPVSYFDEEKSNEVPENNEKITDTSFGKTLTALFETNLHSVQNDLQRVNVRRQSQQNNQIEVIDTFDKVFDNVENGENEDNASIERFITYEDQEDHLKAVDNTFLINQKNINDDIRRFAHFKQHSIEQHDIGEVGIDRKIDDSVSYDSGFSNEAASNVEEMINLMPDAVQDLPDDLQINERSPGLEMNLDSVLPDAFNGDPVMNSSLDSVMTRNNSNPVESNANENLLIDLESKTDTQKDEIQNHSIHSSCFDIPVTSVSSTESINEVIRAAEAIVKDSRYGREIIVGDFESATSTENEALSIGRSRHNDELVIKKHENINISGSQITNVADASDTHLLSASSTLIPNLERGTGIADTSLSSLHDELINASPGHDFHEPFFNGSEGLSESNQVDSVEIETAVPDITSLPSPVSVKKKVPRSPRKHPRKGKHSSKYIVQVIKQGSEDAATDSGSESDVSTLKSETSIHDMLGSGQICSETEMLLSDSSQNLANKSTQNVSELNSTPNLNVTPSNEIVALAEDSSTSKSPNHTHESGFSSLDYDHETASKPLGDDSTYQQLSNKHNSESHGQTVTHESQTAHCESEVIHGEPQTESEAAKCDDILHLTSQISSQLADEVLNEGNGGNDQSNDHGNVFTDSNQPTEQIIESQDIEESSTTHARAGSTSENEDLEEFVNEQLDAASLPPFSDSPPPTVPEGVTQQVVEEIQLGWYAPKWIPDKDSKGCMNCGIKFTVVKRRHHCRACGKVMCANCCNMKAELPYLGYKAGRVCQTCNEVLGRAQSLLPLPLMTGSQDVPGRGHTISLNDGEPTTPSINDSPPQYMPESPPEYSLVPGTSVQNGPPNPPSYFPSSVFSSSSSSPSPSSSSRRLSRNRTESDRSAVIMFNSSQTDLPPILRIENEVVKIINNPDLKGIFQRIKSTEDDPVAFLVNKNLVVKVKVISLDCCLGKQCWCFSTDGMGASNQEEIIFVVEYTGVDNKLLKCVFQQLNTIFERAKHGEPISDLGLVLFDDFMLNDPSNVGMLLFKQTVQCVNNMFVPCHPHLFGIWVQQTEIPWAKNLPLRLLLRLGAEFKQYPCPLFNLQKRDPVFTTLGRTIVDLLADFRNFQYTLPRITGLLISVSKKETLIKLPQSRYDEILKVLNVSEENVLAFCGNFHRKADGHLVCIENDGTYSTQTITCRSTNKKVTGCSFAVFSAALKQNPENIHAKSSVVEDGVMVQLTAETMKKLRKAIKEMQDLVISPDPPTEQSNSESNRLKLVWGSSDDSSTRTTSPIDGSSFDGLTNMRIRHSYDFTVSTSPAKIHWQEVYFLPNDADTVGRLSAKELSQMTSSVAKACMNALSPHLSTLVALNMTKIGLRISLESDSVEYQIGANKEQMPQELTGELDDKLIPVIHSVMKKVPHRRVSAELIFQIARIV